MRTAIDSCAFDPSHSSDDNKQQRIVEGAEEADEAESDDVQDSRCGKALTAHEPAVTSFTCDIIDGEGCEFHLQVRFQPRICNARIEPSATGWSSHADTFRLGLSLALLLTSCGRCAAQPSEAGLVWATLLDKSHGGVRQRRGNQCEPDACCIMLVRMLLSHFLSPCKEAIFCPSLAHPPEPAGHRATPAAASVSASAFTPASIADRVAEIYMELMMEWLDSLGEKAHLAHAAATTTHCSSRALVNRAWRGVTSPL